MATITVNYGSGGGHMAPFGHDSQPALAEVLRDIADDLGGIQPVTAVIANGVHAAGAAPTAAEYDALVDLVNELKGIINTNAGVSLKTLKG
jgi:hypothetical protein